MLPEMQCSEDVDCVVDSSSVVNRCSGGCPDHVVEVCVSSPSKTARLSQSSDADEVPVPVRRLVLQTWRMKSEERLYSGGS